MKPIVNFKGLKQAGIPYSRVHIMRLMKAGRFPRAFKLNDYQGSPLVWWAEDVQAWLERRCAS